MNHEARLLESFEEALLLRETPFLLSTQNVQHRDDAHYDACAESAEAYPRLRSYGVPSLLGERITQEARLGSHAGDHDRCHVCLPVSE